MEHHLYVYDNHREDLAKHIAFRNYLRTNSEAVAEYTKLKKRWQRPQKNVQLILIVKLNLLVRY
ncbi:GrpB family protein [Niallia sp. 03133]|uniref:GrpB family protein n=1 Tax=Niallia sp. 03133 TaxID=3458060 RepID=UPI00404489AE